MSNTYSTVVLQDNPIRYYRLNETAGTVANDLGSQSQNGTLNGGITLNQAGLIAGDTTDASMLFNGTTGFISVPTTGLPTGASPFTIEAWVKVPGTIASGDIVGFGSSNTTQIWWLDSRSGAFDFRQWAGTAVSGGTPVINTIFHLVGTFDGTTARLYVNGSNVNSATPTSNIVASIAKIGNVSGNFFNGNIAEVAWYNTALSSTRILAHYTNGTSVNTGLLAIPTNTTNTIIQATDVNQVINVLQRASGQQEIGHYILHGNGYTLNALIAWYVPSLSRGSTPVSNTLDAADIANTGYTVSPANNDRLTASGFHVYDFAATGPQPNTIIGGNYTIQY